MTGTGSKVLADRKAADPHANRLLGLLGITGGFARIFTALRWSTGSRSIALTSPSNLFISSRPVSAPW